VEIFFLIPLVGALVWGIWFLVTLGSINSEIKDLNFVARAILDRMEPDLDEVPSGASDDSVELWCPKCRDYYSGTREAPNCPICDTSGHTS
jgi:hypothetical protein